MPQTDYSSPDKRGDGAIFADGVHAEIPSKRDIGGPIFADSVHAVVSPKGSRLHLLYFNTC